MTDVYFQNSYDFTVSVAIMYYRPDICTGAGDWLVQGWYNLEKNSPPKYIFSTSNQYFYLYAEGGGQSTNGPFWAYVEQQAFVHCRNTTTGRLVGMTEIDNDNLATHTINFTP